MHLAEKAQSFEYVKDSLSWSKIGAALVVALNRIQPVNRDFRFTTCAVSGIDFSSPRSVPHYRQRQNKIIYMHN